MKIKVSISTIFLGLFIAILSTSCNKKDDPTPVQPDYPELIGTWQGTTSQNQLVRFGIFNFNGLLVINTYKFTALKWDTDTTYRVKTFDFNLSSIITSVVDKYFAFVPQGSFASGDYLKGTFDVATMKLTGQFKTSFPTPSGASVDYVTGTFTCLKVANSSQ
ncbi:MAG: hypothetical protein NT004_19735 [Bacteroidetes bacterium]|nr:hypothetical protein [Bacteroidota bacterium]